MNRSLVTVTLVSLIPFVFSLAGRASTQVQPEANFELVNPCFNPLAVTEKDLCGLVSVPENRADPGNQRRIKLAVIVRKATQANSKPDPIVVLAGGPGVSATAALRGTLAELSRVTPDRDLILIDQRGIGYGEPLLDCSVEARQEPMLTDVGRLARCRERLGSLTDLSAYNTNQNAQDIQDVVRTLGYTQWNALGLSFGSRLALTLLANYPQGLRSVVLDGVFATHINGLEDQSVAVLQVLNRIAGKQKNLVNTIAQAISNGTSSVPMAQLWLTLTSSPSEAILEQRLLDLRNKNVQATNILGNNSASTLPNRFFSFPMALSVICQEELANANFAKTALQLDSSWHRALVEHIFKSGLVDLSKRIIECRIWNLGRAERVQGFVSSKLPILVLGDTHDFQTPLEWATPTAQHLGRAQQITTRTLGHVISRTVCGAELSQAFFNNPNVRVEAGKVKACTGFLP
jgi:pimeloyl-ACP methyl ester carboxylesterase